MGLLDAIFGDSGGGGGLLGGLPREWQYQNPQSQGFGGPIFAGPQLTPTEQQMMGMVSGGDQPQQPSTQQQPLTPTERQMMSMVQPGASSAPPAAPPLPAAPAPQAGPMSIGGYQMPRMGSPDLYQPQQVMTPPNAQPAQGQMVQGQQAPQMDQSQLPPALGGANFGGNLGAGLQSLVNTPGGLIQKVLAGVTGGVTGQRTDPAGLQQQNLVAQYRALIAAGLTPQNAQLAVLNPEAGKTLIQEALTNKEKYGVINEDPLQGKQYGFINEREQTINGKPISSVVGGTTQQAQGLQALTDRITGLRESNASKEQLLAQIPSGYRDDVKSLIDGKGVPANMGRAQSRMAILTLAKVVDPSFDETMIPTRIAMRKDFSGEGKNGQAIGSFNTAQHHIDKLSDDLEELAKYNGNYPALNSARGWLANKADTNPKLRDSMQAVNDDMAAVSHEVANAYNSGHLSDHDMATWNKLTSTDLPPDQLRRGISDFVDLLNGKRDSLNHMYRQAFGQDAPTIEGDKNAAITTKVHQRLPDYARNREAPSAPAAALPSGWSVKVH